MAIAFVKVTEKMDSSIYIKGVVNSNRIINPAYIIIYHNSTYSEIDVMSLIRPGLS